MAHHPLQECTEYLKEHAGVRQSRGMKLSTYSWSLNFKCRAGWPQTSFFISKRLQQALIISVALDKGSVMGQMKNCLRFFHPLFGKEQPGSWGHGEKEPSAPGLFTEAGSGPLSCSRGQTHHPQAFCWLLLDLFSAWRKDQLCRERSQLGAVILCCSELHAQPQALSSTVCGSCSTTESFRIQGQVLPMARGGTEMSLRAPPTPTILGFHDPGHDHQVCRLRRPC